MSPPRKSRNELVAGPASSKERRNTGLISGRDIRDSSGDF
uniref:Uncharacterized protein n=1 Tax=Rhizophora mucronata TaxID=61149 RepID=A0A2P2IUA0_RHIMU